MDDLGELTHTVPRYLLHGHSAAVLRGRFEVHRLYDNEIMQSHVLRVIIEEDCFENGFPAYHAFCPVLKGCHTWGYSPEEALTNIREAVVLYLDDLNDAGL